jgi:hypothetical protein
LVLGKMMYRKEPRQAAALLPIMSEAISLHYRLRCTHSGPLCGALRQSGSSADLRPAQALGAQLSDRAALGVLAQFVQLHLCVLVVCRDAGIEGDALDGVGYAFRVMRALYLNARIWVITIWVSQDASSIGFW